MTTFRLTVSMGEQDARGRCGDGSLDARARRRAGTRTALADRIPCRGSRNAVVRQMRGPIFRVLWNVDERRESVEHVGCRAGGAPRRAGARGAKADRRGSPPPRRGGGARAPCQDSVLVDVRVLHAGARHVRGRGVQEDPGGAGAAQVSGGRGGGGGGAPEPDRGRDPGAAPHARKRGAAGRRGERQEQGRHRDPPCAACAAAGRPGAARARGRTDSAAPGRRDVRRAGGSGTTSCGRAESGAAVAGEVRAPAHHQRGDPGEAPAGAGAASPPGAVG